MAQETKNIGIGIVLSLLITVGVSISARLYFDRQAVQVSQVKELRM